MKRRLTCWMRPELPVARWTIMAAPDGRDANSLHRHAVFKQQCWLLPRRDNQPVDLEVRIADLDHHIGSGHQVVALPVEVRRRGLDCDDHPGLGMWRARRTGRRLRLM